MDIDVKNIHIYIRDLTSVHLNPLTFGFAY